jgi:hypothetical protein
VIDIYLAGSITQLVERARAMTAHIPRDLPRAYDTLAQTCRKEINSCIAELRRLKEDPLFSAKQCQPERLRKFRRIVSDLDFLETVAIVALNKAQDDDHRLNAFLERVCREIAYPGVIPVVTTLSQDYFHIYPELHLLCVPLIEGNFLLHLPDLYHELAHPLLVVQDDPLIEPFQKRFSSTMRECLGYIRAEQVKEGRRNGPARSWFMLKSWESSWAKFWLTEFYCDLFALFTVGPAYAWSHLHLAMKRGGNPFAVPELSASSHPSDDARMQAMLYGLELIGFADASSRIGGAWTAVHSSLGARPEPEYDWCFPKHLLQQIARDALSGTRDLKLQMPDRSCTTSIAARLNVAWEKFWSDPESFPAWERHEVEVIFGD